MNKTFLDAVKHRRSYYDILPESTVSDDRLEEIIGDIVKSAPSAFNSQSSRVVLLLNEEHADFWNITEAELKKVVAQEKFAPTKEKIESFRRGYGTVLYFEETEVVKSLQEKFPSYAQNFAKWSEHTNAIHQFAIWTALEDEGLGASLQHYTELIEEAVKKRWELKPSWKLIAQMPFGKPGSKPHEKEVQPLTERFLVKK
ncbi:MAG: nitroreductase family protein [Filifactor alocis]|nr:nitroreductase family protein [Filifactor alocis]